MKASELTGPPLDWAVAKCEELDPYVVHQQTGYIDPSHGATIYFRPSTDWAQGGPIIERENITITNHIGYHPTRAGEEWIAKIIGKPIGVGPTPLIAAMRCYVASKLGEEIDIPKELL